MVNVYPKTLRRHFAETYSKRYLQQNLSIREHLRKPQRILAYENYKTRSHQR